MLLLLRVIPILVLASTWDKMGLKSLAKKHVFWDTSWALSTGLGYLLQDVSRVLSIGSMRVSLEEFTRCAFVRRWLNVSALGVWEWMCAECVVKGNLVHFFDLDANNIQKGSTVSWSHRTEAGSNTNLHRDPFLVPQVVGTHRESSQLSASPLN